MAPASALPRRPRILCLVYFRALRYAARVRQGGAVAGAAFLFALTGCSGVPLLPGRWFEPSPTPISTPTGAGADRRPELGPDVQFDGVLVTESGLRAAFSSRLWFGQTSTTPQLARPRPSGWVRVDVQLRGELAITNIGDRPNPAAASVTVEYLAGYPAASRVCQLLDAPDPADRNSAGGMCWQSIADATPFSYAHGPPISIQPGAGQVTDFAGGSGADGIAADTPVAELQTVAAALTKPAVIVAVTRTIPGLGPEVPFVHACTETSYGPPQSTTGTNPSDQQRVIVGATRYVSCDMLPGFR